MPEAGDVTVESRIPLCQTCQRSLLSLLRREQIYLVALLVALVIGMTLALALTSSLYGLPRP